MFRNAAALLLVSLALASQAAPTLADDDALVGTWEVNHDGYNEIWTIAKDKDDWSVSGVFKEKGAEVGSWKGGAVKVADGKLTCTQQYAVKPNPTWSDDTKLSATAKGDKLTFTWDNGDGANGKREMTRVKASAADGADLVGAWKVEHDGYTEVWDVRMVKGAWDVKGLFYKKNKQVGAWMGADVAFADGKLSCTQKYLMKPEANWSDATKLTAQMSNDKLDFTWDNGGGQSGTREMTKVGK